MRFYVLFAPIAFFLISCSSRENTNSKDLGNIEIKELAEKSRLDSVKKQEELTVIGSIRFGMNRDEFEKSKDEFIEKCKVYYGEDKKYSHRKIGDYEFYHIYGSFYKDKLYKIEISGQPIGYKVYDNNMRIAYDGLFNVLSHKYGFPTDNLGFPAWHTITDDGRGSAYWLLGDKKILMVVEPYKNDSYSLKLYIYQPSISLLIKEENELKRKNAVIKGVEVL